MKRAVVLEHRSLLRELYRCRALDRLDEEQEGALNDRMASLWEELTEEERIGLDHMTATFNALGPEAFGAAHRERAEAITEACEVVAVQGPFLAAGCGARLLLFRRDSGQLFFADPWAPDAPLVVSDDCLRSDPELLRRLDTATPLPSPGPGWIAIVQGVELLKDFGPGPSGAIPLVDGNASELLVARRDGQRHLSQWVDRLVKAAAEETDEGRKESLVRALWSSPILDSGTARKLSRVLRGTHWHGVKGASLLLDDMEHVVSTHQLSSAAGPRKASFQEMRSGQRVALERGMPKVAA